MSHRRLLFTHVLVASLLALVGAAHAQDGPVKMIVPFGPGTTTDTIARVVAEGLGRELKQTVIVDNRAGAGGTVGSDMVAKAAPDGRTIVMGTVGTHAINASLFRKMPYDTLRDFAPVAFIGYTPTLLVVRANSSVKSLKDLTALAARPEGVTFASAGNGTSGHLAGELLAQRLGGRMIHVPYKEGAVAMTSVMSGQADFMFYRPAAVMPQIRAGKLRAIGASGAVRSSAA
ncbi:MAG: tripartite tricarboxylate transporter substrate-binding protein, partial [Burkholderiales bacterium]